MALWAYVAEVKYHRLIFLFSIVQAKIFQALQGELNYSNYMGIAEMKEKVLQLRQGMQRANNYAYGNDHVSVSIWAWKPILDACTVALPLRLSFSSSLPLSS